MKKPSDDFTRKEILEIAGEFKRRRNYLGLTQIRLAKIARLSQSIINKLERGKIDPTYSTILKIERALESQENVSNFKAENIMIENIISITPQTKISKAIEIMSENDYSQLLVLMRGELIGVIYEKTILGVIGKKVDIYKNTVKDYIETSPIIVPPKFSAIDLSFIFMNRKTKFVLVGERGKILGLITKSDLFKR